jgi:hypothetical protein
MTEVMSRGPHPAISRYTNLRNEPVTRLFAPITGYQDMPLVSLEESIKSVSHLFHGIEENVSVAKAKCINPADGLSQDESASIHLYTMEFDSEPSLYHVLNGALCDENRQTLKPWSSFLRLFFTALHKLPSYAQTVWRGLCGEDLSSKYRTKSKFAWWCVCSCTATIEVLRSNNFLGSTGLQTLFSIECQNGKSVASHSYFKDREKEIILMPGSYFEVVQQLNPAKDLQIIHLKEIQPPYPLVKPPHGIVPLPVRIAEPSGIITWNMQFQFTCMLRFFLCTR